MGKQMRFIDYKTSKKESGFTLVELLIAVMFFSFILLFIASGFIALNRQFVKGRTARDIQNDARFVIEDITRSLRSSGSGGITPSNLIQQNATMCFGGSQYTWTTLSAIESSGTADNNQYSDTSNDIRLARTQYGGGDCDVVNVSSANSVELIGPNTAVQYIDVSNNFGGIASLYKIVVVLSTTQDEIIIGRDENGAIDTSGEFATCEALQLSGDTNTEYCSVVKFETVVNIRK